MLPSRLHPQSAAAKKAHSVYIQEGDIASSKPLPRAGVVSNLGPVSLRISEVESIRKELEEFLERLKYDPEDKESTKNSVYLGENQSSSLLIA